MSRRNIRTPTTNPYMWDDVASYILFEDGTGIELESRDGYLMMEAWRGHNMADLQGDWNDILTTDILKARNRMRRIRT